MKRMQSARLAASLAVLAGAMMLGSCNGDKVVEPKTQVVVARLAVVPALDTLNIGQSLQLAGTAYDADSVVLPTVALTWLSQNPAVATVDGGGLVTAVAEGTAELTASYGGQASTSTITVYQVPAAVIVDPPASDIRVGDKITLLALPKAADGTTIGGQLTYTSSDTTIAKVSPLGQVTAVGEGSVTITASSGGKTASAQLSVHGQAPAVDEGLGNNLSVPVVFAEGLGLTGLPVSDAGERAYLSTGMRPTADEGVTVKSLPFFYVANQPNSGGYYLQNTGNIWQAEWLDGSTMGMQHAEAQWGDNLTHHTWQTGMPIRVEVSLNDLSSGALTGYNMTALSGSGRTELQGTDGTTSAMTPTIFTVVPRLVVQKLSGENGTVVQTLVDKPVAAGLGAEESPGFFGAEVNVAGRVIYGYSLNIGSLTMDPGVSASGWWRIAFVLDNGATVGGRSATRNVTIDRVTATEALDSESEALLYQPQAAPNGQSTWVDIKVDSTTNGGGGSGGGGADSDVGNNLSNPVTFAEGIGLTGLPVSEDAGLRPTSTEGITVGDRPFFFSGNSSDCAVGGAPFFCQQGRNVWQAQWYDASGQPTRDAEVAWGDNLLSNTFNTHMNVHVEITLTDSPRRPCRVQHGRDLWYGLHGDAGHRRYHGELHAQRVHPRRAAHRAIAGQCDPRAGVHAARSGRVGGRRRIRPVRARSVDGRAGRVQLQPAHPEPHALGPEPAQVRVVALHLHARPLGTRAAECPHDAAGSGR